VHLCSLANVYQGLELRFGLVGVRGFVDVLQDKNC